MGGITLINLILSAFTTIFNIILSFITFLKFKNPNLRIYLLMYSVLILILLLGLRDRGWDYHLYKSIYEGIPELGDLSFYDTKWIEPGFRLILSTFKTIGLNYQLSLLLIGIITLLLIYKTVIRFSINPIFSIVLFYFLYFYRGAYGQIRAALAMAIIIYSVKYIFNNKPLKFFLLMIIASSIHVVSIAFIPAYFLLKRNYSNRVLVSLIFFSLIISFFSKDIYDYIVNFDISFLYKFKFYYLNNLYIEREFVTFEMAKGIILSLLFLKLRKKINKINDINKLLIILYVIGVVIYNLLSFDLRFASRISRVYKIFEILLLPSLISVPRTALIKVLVYVAILLLCIYTIVVEFLMMRTGSINYYLN